MEALFALHGKSFRICDDSGNDLRTINVDKLNRSTVYACRAEDAKPTKISEIGPFARLDIIKDSDNNIVSFCTRIKILIVSKYEIFADF